MSSLALKRIFYILLRTWAEWWLNIRRHIIFTWHQVHNIWSKEKERTEKKREKRKLAACENRRKRACLIFRSLGGTSHPHPFLRTLSRTYLLFPNWKHSEKRYQKTDKACSRDLCRVNCFAREAQEIVWDFCTWGWMNLQLSYRAVSKCKWFFGLVMDTRIIEILWQCTRQGLKNLVTCLKCRMTFFNRKLHIS